MKNFKKLIFSLAAILLTFSLACDTNDVGPEYTGESTQYLLQSRNASGVTGTVTFDELVGGFTQITMELTGTPVGGDHPAHIHFNTAAEGGDIAISLTNVNGTDGRSLSVIEQTNAGDPITYDELINFDGYINVHLSPQDLTVVAQTDIGANALTGNMASYGLTAVNASGINGTVTFYERKNGTTLGLIDAENTPENGIHPAHIHNNSVSEGGGIAVSFNPVDGSTGISRTQIEGTDDGTSLTFTEILTFDGYVNIHLSSADLTVVSQGNIGANADAQNNTGGGYGY